MRRTLHDLGNPLTGRPREMILIYSQHYCTRCRKYFNADMTDLAAPGSHYTKRVVDTAVRLVIEDGLQYRAASWTCGGPPPFVPYATIQNWVEDGGEKAERQSPPITSTGHSPTSRAISPPTSCMTARSVSCRSSITAPSSGCSTMSWTATRPKSTSRHSSPLPPGLGGTRVDRPGITTDGSTLYPEPIVAVFGAVPHQVCQFHILHEVNKAILSAVAQERKRLAAGAPKLPRGRPSSKAAKRAAGRTKRIKQKVGELFAPPVPVRPAAAQPV